MKSLCYLITISLLMILAGCGNDDAGFSNSFSIDSVSPQSGVVTGGTVISLTGIGMDKVDTVTIGGTSCVVDSSATTKTELSCTTGSNPPFGGSKDVVISTGTGLSATMSGGFEYTCPWLHNGVGNCGAYPPTAATTQTVDSTITTFQAGHGFTANAGGSHNYNDTAIFSLGTQSASITSNGAGAAKTLKRTGFGPFDFTGKMVRVTVRVDSTTNASALQIYLGDTNLANHFKFSFLSTQGQLWVTEGDWVTFTIPWTGSHVTTSGTPSRSNITDIQFRVVDDSGAAVTLRVNEVSIVNEQSTYANGVASITFDDGFSSQYSVAKPLMDALGYKATAYIIKERIDTDGDYLTLSNLKEMHNSGWEIAAHAFAQATHSSSYTGLAAVTDLQDDIVSSRAWLISNNFTGYNHCAYPKGQFTGGAYNVLTTVSSYFTSCRTINQRHRETIPPSNPHKLRVFYITNATTLADVQTAVDFAVANKEWIIFSFHKIVTTPALSTEWATSDFTSFLNYLNTKGIAVKKVGEIL